ncbi:YybS family protein [Bacillus sp. AK031]
MNWQVFLSDYQLNLDLTIDKMSIYCLRGVNVKNPRTLTEGALLLAIFTVLLLLSAYVPIVSFIFVFLPLPFIMHSEKHGWKPSLTMLAGAIFISLLAGSFVVTLPLTLFFAPVGIVIGLMIRHGKPKVTLYLTSSLVLLINIVVVYVVSILFLNINIVSDSLSLYRDTITEAIRRAEEWGQPLPDKSIENFNTLLDLIEVLVPTLFVSAAFVISLLLLAVNFPVLKKFGIKPPKFPPFRNWKLPQSIVWYYLITLILMITVKPEMGTYFHSALFNLLYILQTLLIIQGFSFVHFFGHIKKWPKGVVILITVLMLPLISIVRILGIIDLGFDLRQRLQRKS